MVTANHIKDVILDYLLHDDSNRFLVEFSRLSYNIGERGDAAAIALANKVESRLADVRVAIISKPAFKEELRSLSISSIYVSTPIITDGSTLGFSPVPDWVVGPLTLVPLASKQPA